MERVDEKRKGGARFVLICFLLSRAFILLIGLAYFYSFYPGEPPAPKGYVESQGPLTWHPLSFLDFYDTTNYLNIAREGYSARQAPFFPLFPLLLRLVGIPAGGATLESGILLSNLCFLAFLFLVHRLWGRGAVIAACLAPAGIFFMTAYTESLFVLVSAASLLGLRHKRWGVAAFFTGLAALTRPVGWTLLAAYCLYTLFLAPGRKKAWVLLALGLTALYPLYLAIAFEDPLLFLHVEASRFFRELVFPGWGVLEDLKHIFRGIVPAEWAMMAIFNLVGVFLLALALRKSKGWLETDHFRLFTLFYLLMILMTPITDFTYVPATHAALRYACGCVPLYALVGGNRALLIAFVPLQIMVTLMMTVKWFIM